MFDTNYILTSDGTFMSDNELRHYGIKGMKWGFVDIKMRMEP